MPRPRRNVAGGSGGAGPVIGAVAGAAAAGVAGAAVGGILGAIIDSGNRPVPLELGAALDRFFAERSSELFVVNRIGPRSVEVRFMGGAGGVTRLRATAPASVVGSVKIDDWLYDEIVRQAGGIDERFEQ